MQKAASTRRLPLSPCTRTRLTSRPPAPTPRAKGSPRRLPQTPKTSQKTHRPLWRTTPMCLGATEAPSHLSRTAPQTRPRPSRMLWDPTRHRRTQKSCTPKHPHSPKHPKRHPHTHTRPHPHPARTQQPRTTSTTTSRSRPTKPIPQRLRTAYASTHHQHG